MVERNFLYLIFAKMALLYRFPIKFFLTSGLLPASFWSYLKSSSVSFANWKAIFGISVRWLSDKCSCVILKMFSVIFCLESTDQSEIRIQALKSFQWKPTSGISPHISIQVSKLICVIILPFKFKIWSEGNIIKLVQLYNFSKLFLWIK